MANSTAAAEFEVPVGNRGDRGTADSLMILRPAFGHSAAAEPRLLIRRFGWNLFRAGRSDHILMEFLVSSWIALHTRVGTAPAARGMKRTSAMIWFVGWSHRSLVIRTRSQAAFDP